MAAVWPGPVTTAMPDALPSARSGAQHGARTKRHLVWVTLATVVGVGATTSLGLWQLGRAQLRNATQAAIEARSALEPITPGTWPRAEVGLPAAVHRRARLTGRWMHAHTLALDNRPMAGRAGFLVLTPLLLDSGDVVVVQRGWLPRQVQDRSRVDLPVNPSGSAAVYLEGRVMPSPSRVLEIGQPLAQGTGPVRQNLDRADWARTVGKTMLPGALLQLGPETSAPPVTTAPATEASTQATPSATTSATTSAAASSATPPSTPPLPKAPPTSPPQPDADGRWRHWPAAGSGADKNLGYAFQWFALATLILGLYVWFQIIRPRRRAGHPHGNT